MKLIKLLFIFLPTYAFADMDKVCTIDIQQTAATKKDWQEVYKNDCFRNNGKSLEIIPERGTNLIKKVITPHKTINNQVIIFYPIYLKTFLLRYQKAPTKLSRNLYLNF